MITPNLEVTPCSPQIVMQQPEFSKTLKRSDNASTNGEKSGGGILSTFSKAQKKLSMSSFTTSVDTDDEVAPAVAKKNTTTSFGNTLQDCDPDEISNASLSDSMTSRDFHDKLHDGLHSNKYKKLKKKQSKFTQMIAGVSYKSKVDLFQKLFQDINSNEKLIIDYSCAFHRDILVQGRLYLSQNWLCFYANIFGWETLITVQWSDVTAITKEKTAKVIPNAIQVLTDTEKYFFTTFVTREDAYTALFRIWQNALLGHPMQPDELKTICRKYRQKKSEPMDGDPIHDCPDETGDEIAEEDLPSTNGSTEQLNRQDLTGDMTSELPDTNGSSLSNSYPNHYEHDKLPEVGDEEKSQPTASVAESNERVMGVSNDGVGLVPSSGEGGGRISPNSAEQKDETMDRIKQAFKNGVSSRTFSKAQDLFSKKKKKKKKKKSHQQRGHSVHLVVPPDDLGETTTDFDDEADSDASTDDRLVDEEILCPCHDSHKGKEYANEEFNFDVDTLFDHLFSQDSDMMKRVFEERKHDNWKYTPLEKDEEGCDTQTLTYTLSLNYSIGPKTSDTVSKQTFLKCSKPGSFYVIDTENRSLGVPYSDSFHVSVQYCITKCSGNRARLKVHGEVVYVKRVFGLVKNMISRNGEEALREYYVYLVNLLHSESQLAPPASSTNLSAKRKKLTKKVSKEQSKVSETTRKKSSHGPGLPSMPVTSKVQNTSAAPKSPYSSTAVLTISLLVLLLFGMNLYLLRRLGHLESVIDLSRKARLPKDLPANEEQWKNLLQRQKDLHDFEIIKLKEVIGNTALLMKQVEGSISFLYSEMDKDINTKLSDEKADESPHTDKQLQQEEKVKSDL